MWIKSNRSGKRSSWHSAQPDQQLPKAGGKKAFSWKQLDADTSAEPQDPYSASSRLKFIPIKTLRSFFRSFPPQFPPIFFFYHPQRNRKGQKAGKRSSHLWGREHPNQKHPFFSVQNHPYYLYWRSPKKCFQKVARAASAFYALTAICSAGAGFPFFSSLCMKRLLLFIVPLHSEATKQSKKQKVSPQTLVSTNRVLFGFFCKRIRQFSEESSIIWFWVVAYQFGHIPKAREPIELWKKFGEEKEKKCICWQILDLIKERRSWLTVREGETESEKEVKHSSREMVSEISKIQRRGV